MAFTLRDIGSPCTDSSSTATVLCTKPAGTTTDDFLLCVIQMRQSADPTTVPSGWNLLAKSQVGTGTAYVWVYWKVATGSEPTDYTWTWAVANRARGRIYGYYGDYDTSDPIDTYSNTIYSTSNSTCRAAGITVAEADSILMLVTDVQDGTGCAFTVATNPGTFTEDDDSYSVVSDASSSVSHYEWSSSGATGAVDVTITRSGGSPEVTTTTKHAILFALSPAITEYDVSVSDRAVVSDFGDLRPRAPRLEGSGLATMWTYGRNDKRILRNAR